MGGSTVTKVLAIVTASNDSKTSSSDMSQPRLIRDLQGRLIKIKSFSAEIQTTLTALHDLLVSNQGCHASTLIGNGTTHKPRP